ncbi:MAG: hypothetical protein H8E37_00730 [Planctomycetes bacterium]|nr:hypothetical protein [Planctomycetota bacterium]
MVIIIVFRSRDDRFGLRSPASTFGGFFRRLVVVIAPGGGFHFDFFLGRFLSASRLFASTGFGLFFRLSGTAFGLLKDDVRCVIPGGFCRILFLVVLFDASPTGGRFGSRSRALGYHKVSSK